MSFDKAVAAADAAALEEIRKYGLPTMVHYSLSNAVGARLAEALGGNLPIVQMGTALMDLKLGEAFSTGRLKEHVRMSEDAARSLLGSLLDEPSLEAVLHCIEAHHGTVKYRSLDAEICANADCYRFVHPLGALTYLGTLGKRSLAEAELFTQSSVKLEEKWHVLSLPACKAELQPHYDAFRLLLDSATSELRKAG